MPALAVVPITSFHASKTKVCPWVHTAPPCSTQVNSAQ